LTGKNKRIRVEDTATGQPKPIASITLPEDYESQCYLLPFTVDNITTSTVPTMKAQRGKLPSLDDYLSDDYCRPPPTYIGLFTHEYLFNGVRAPHGQLSNLLTTKFTLETLVYGSVEVFYHIERY
jgi:hypothetical protein